MALKGSMKSICQSDDHQSTSNEDDEEIDETEDDLIENYLYLTRRCAVLKHSPTTSALDSFSSTRPKLNSSSLMRQYSLATDHLSNEYERSLSMRKSHSSLNDVNNNNYSKDSSNTTSRIPPTIYYDTQDEDDYFGGPFSLVKLFARMKARLKHDRRYRADSTHELLKEEDPQDWLELTKNTREILTKALLPDGGYDAFLRNSRSNGNSTRRKDRESDPVLSFEIEDEDERRISFDLDHRYADENDDEYDEIIWRNFHSCSRGFYYRRVAVCKAIDRQEFQGQLVYVYGVANNILIDENLKASGLG